MDHYIPRSISTCKGGQDPVEHPIYVLPVLLVYGVQALLAGSTQWAWRCVSLFYLCTCCAMVTVVNEVDNPALRINF